MSRLSPESYKPILSFRYKIIFSVLDGIEVFGRTVSLPKIENNPISIEYGNTYMMLKGKSRWEPVTITCYAFEKITHEKLWQYLNELHQKIEDGKDFYADQYKSDLQIQILSPSADKLIGTFTLIGAFIQSIDFGKLDYELNEVVQPELTFVYDYAKYEPNYNQV